MFVAILIIGLALTLILNKDLRNTISKRIQEIIVASTIETKIEYEIQPLERRKVKHIPTNRKPKWNRANSRFRWNNTKMQWKEKSCIR